MVKKKYIEDLENAQRVKELLQTISGAMKKLKELGSLSIVGRIKVDEDLLFIRIGDHLEFNPVFINYLGLIDLSSLYFVKNLKVSGIDFSGTNAYLNP